jgi:hypothetical protein
MPIRKSFWIVVAAIVLIPAAAIVWWLASPLFISKTVQEEFPLSADAVIPDNMSRGEVEKVLAGMAKVAQEMSEEMSGAMTAAAKVKTGSFRDADGFHKGSGQASIYRLKDGSHLLRLDNLKVTNGPSLHVILTKHANPMTRADVDQGYTDLGKLKGNIGNQNYAIPADPDLSSKASAVIYCKAFHVIFSVADLQNP